MKPTLIKVKTPGFIFHLSFVSDSPITHNIEQVLNERLKDIYLNPDIHGLIFGKHFYLDATTINGRKYSSQLWHEIIESDKFQENLKAGKYYGLIGHDGRPANDLDHRNNLITHRICDMWIEDKVGFAISSVFGVNGKELANQLKAGIYLQPSTRGTIAYAGITDLNTSNYNFLGIDYVTNPALPQVDTIFLNVEKVEPNDEAEIVSASESIEFIPIENVDNGDDNMANQELIDEIRSSRDQALAKVSELEAKIEIKDQELTDLKIANQILENNAKEKDALIDKLQFNFDEASKAYQSRLGKYHDLHTEHVALESKLKELESHMAEESEVNNIDKIADLLEEQKIEVAVEENDEAEPQVAPAAPEVETIEPPIDLYTEEQLIEAVKECGSIKEINEKKVFFVVLDEKIKVEDKDGKVFELDPEHTKELIVFEDEPSTLYTD